jgi:hypothetical protein
VIEIKEFEVAGNRVLVRQHMSARGAGSGIEMEIESWTVWTFDDDGKATRMQFFLPNEEDEARLALRGG